MYIYTFAYTYIYIDMYAYIYTGLGSRGLIHHSILGELLAKAIMSNDASLLPPETRRIPLLHEWVIGK